MKGYECEKCGSELQFHQIQGMRLLTEVGYVECD